MTEYFPKEEKFASLKDKVVVVTGGANGMGASLVELLHQNGAHVFFGDVQESDANELIQRLKSTPIDPEPQLQFVKTDVSSYADNLALFQTAFDACGRVDHAIAGAGVGEPTKLVDPELTLESVKEPPRTRTIEINLLGPLYLARLASVYLRQGVPADANRNCSMVFISSSAGILEESGLFTYQPAKHGVIGLMRSMRSYLPDSTPQPIRTNVVCPWFTSTKLTSGVEAAWSALGLPKNTPEELARVIAGTLVDSNLNGETLFVTLGGRAWAIEDKLIELRPQWLGQEPAEAFSKFNQKAGWTRWSRHIDK